MPLRAVAVVFAGLLAPALSASAAPAQTPPAAPALKLSAGECEVWLRELSFAQSVADHDAAAFASHVEAQAAFGASLVEPTRGRDAIAQRWAGIVAGKRMKLAWYPTRTTMNPDVPDVAWSSGPALFEDLDPDTKQHYRIGAFHSVWHRGADGVWRVMFDDGVEPRPASEAEVAAFHSGRQGACPPG